MVIPNLTSFLDTHFPQAKKYREHQISSSLLCESPEPFKIFPYRERHIQCLWADSRLRPEHLKTTDGEDVIVEHPGDWNLEAGPDFLRATLLIGKEKRRICGDLEIHIHPNAWKQHHHDSDPHYKNVRFHVVYFQGKEIPGLIQIPLQKSLMSDPYFSFENIDPTAYPYAIPKGNFPLKNIPIDRKIEWLEQAGEERLRIKSERLIVAMQTQSPTQVLWEELMGSLGYKNNKRPFRELAVRLPLERFQSMINTPEEAYAILLGVSGLLPDQIKTSWPEETQLFIRKIWDFWWTKSDLLSPLVLKKKEWVLHGLRPTNHPVRRLMAAAHYLFKITEIVNNPKELTSFPSTFWTTHLSWKKNSSPTALVGTARANAIITNIIIPWRAATNQKPIALDSLPCEPLNHIIKQTAYTLFGPDHTPKTYRTALARQGLIQIFYDYLLPQKIDELRILV